MLDCIFCNFMKNNSWCSLDIKTKLICDMPSDSLSFAVLIGCDPGLIYLFWDCFKFRKHSLFVWRNHVFWAKIILNINSQAFCWEINSMTIRSLDFKISSEKFFNSLWLCWRLHNDKVFWHNDRFEVKDRFLVYGNYWGLQAEIKKAERSFIIKQVKIWFFLFS